MSPPELPEHRVTLSPSRDYIVVWQKGRLVSVAQARAFQARVDEVLAQSGVRKALFDNRDTEAPADDVRDSMFAFVTSRDRFTAVALLLNSEMVAVRVSMSAISLHVKTRAFHSLADAEAWLARQR